jgi:L-alanine-DL-glutamate epimerase-like enolase superfamily enzyme
VARRSLSVVSQRWPIAGTFTISRGSKSEAEVLLATIAEDGGRLAGRGECVPYARYGETVASVTAQIEALRADIEAGLDRSALQAALTPGAARNALDCALWDLEAKRSKRRVWQLAGLAEPQPVVTAFTLSLDSAAAMGAAAKRNAGRPLLKLKVSGPGDLERVRAVRANAPGARLIVDANEGWSAEDLDTLAPQLAALGVELIEQPLPASQDEALAGRSRAVAVCADESCHGLATLDALAGKYDAVNIKLDKTGGLTEALAVAQAARQRGLAVMVGCMVATSLAMAPALLAAQQARYVDLDGPLLLARDRSPGLRYDGSLVHPPAPDLWG